MILLLSRNRPLSAAEARALPTGAQATDGSDGIVARAEVDLPVPQLLGFAVTMGRAAPDAIFVAQESAKPTVAAEAKVEVDPWRAIEAGQLADAERVLTAADPLPQAWRDRVRGLLNDGDPARVALGLRVVKSADLRSMTVATRGLLGHGHPDVRAAAARALGVIAGPSMFSSVAPLQNDPDADVRAAAAEALARWG